MLSLSVALLGSKLHMNNISIEINLMEYLAEKPDAVFSVTDFVSNKLEEAEQSK